MIKQVWDTNLNVMPMTLKSPIFVLIAAVILLNVFSSNLLAETPEFCKRYTTAAIGQYEQAKNLGMAIPFPVWSDNYNHHYNWCLNQSQQTVEQGHAQRQRQIDEFLASRIKQPAPAGPMKPVEMTTGYQVAAPIAGSAQVTVSGLNVASQKRYQLLFPVKNGNRPYIDRDFPFISLVPQLLNGVQIATANEDKFSSEARPFLSFSVDRPVVVYVARDSRYRKLPVWLQSFQQERVQISYAVPGGQVSKTLYSKRYPAGTITLNGNLSNGENENFSMYTVFVVPDSPKVSGATQKTPAQGLKQQTRAYINTFNTIVAQELKNYNVQLDQAIQENITRQKAANAKMASEIPSPAQIANTIRLSIPNDGRAYGIDLREYEALPQKLGEAIDLQKKAKSKQTVVTMQPGATLPTAASTIVPFSTVPVDGLAQITNFPGSDAIEPGDYVYITGVGFGNSPGQVSLDYTINTSEMQQDQWTTYSVPITQVSHGLTWQNNFIMFHLKGMLPDLTAEQVGKGQGIGKAALTLTLANGSKITRQVLLKPAMIKLTSVRSDSSVDASSYSPTVKDHWVRYKHEETRDETYARMPDSQVPAQIPVEYVSIEPGSEVYIHGSGFMDIPGEIEILVAGKKVPIIPKGANWWSNYFITFTVGTIPNFYSREPGVLTIRTSSGQAVTNVGLEGSNVNFAFLYGPRMSVKVVSGEDWFEPEWDEDSSYALPDDNNLVLFVSHDPGCGWFSTSESGWDYFFRNKKMPNGVTLKNFTFMEIQADKANDQINYLKNYLKGLLTSLGGLGFADLALGVITENLKMVAKGVLDSIFGDGGGYIAYMPSMPKPAVPVPTLSIRWENACTGANAGLPIMYSAIFIVTGPKTVLDSM